MRDIELRIVLDGSGRAPIFASSSFQVVISFPFSSITCLATITGISTGPFLALHFSVVPLESSSLGFAPRLVCFVQLQGSGLPIAKFLRRTFDRLLLRFNCPIEIARFGIGGSQRIEHLRFRGLHRLNRLRS